MRIVGQTKDKKKAPPGRRCLKEVREVKRGKKKSSQTREGEGAERKKKDKFDDHKGRIKRVSSMKKS